MKVSILPKPRDMKVQATPLYLDKGEFVLCGNVQLLWLLEGIAVEFSERFQIEPKIIVSEQGEWGFRLYGADSSALICQPLSSAHLEAYRITVNERGIAATAQSYRGSLYAWFTLKQWLQHNNQAQAIAGLNIEDEPDMDVRGFHFDLKGAVPTVAYMKETIERLATYKINTLLIEYENQFPFTSLPYIHRKDGITQEQLRELLDHARKYGMSMIPVVQCISHVDYVLLHDYYAHLREDGTTYQYCPTLPETLTLFQQMIDEVISFHWDSEYIHIGADESFALGQCERCKEHIGEGKSEDLLLWYINQAASYVLSKGKKPMIWDDLFHLEKCIDRVIELPKGTAICSWSYYEKGEDSAWFWYGKKYYSSNKWLDIDPGYIPQLNWLEDLPEDDMNVVRKYWTTDNYPLKGISGVPWIQHYMEQGYEVFGASCVRGADFTNQWIASQQERLDNVSFWAGFANKMGIKGVIASGWTRFYSLSPAVEPWETGWYPTCAHAALTWNGSVSNDEFDAIWVARFLQGEDCLLEGIKLMMQGVEKKEDFMFGYKANYFQAAILKFNQCQSEDAAIIRYRDMLLLSAEQEQIFFELEFALRNSEWMPYYKESIHLRDQDAITKRVINGLNKAMESALHWEKKAQQFCQTFMTAHDAEEVVCSKLYAYKTRYQNLLDSMPQMSGRISFE